MAARILPQTVADAFVEQYYLILKVSPENVHRFYKESSLLGWQGPDGLLTPVTTLSGINEKIMSSDYKNCSVEIVSVDCQESLEGGVIVAVTGLSTWKDNVKNNFNQTFFLAKQEKGFFVMNDILRVFNERESVTSSVSNDDDKQDQASSAPSAVTTTVSDSHAVNKEAVVKNVDVKEKHDLSVVKDTDSRLNTSKPSSPSHDKAPLVVKPASVAKVEAPKISYASIVAKVSPLTSSKAVKVSSNADNRVIAPSITKASSTPSNVAPKSSKSSNVTPKSPISDNVAPKSSVSGNGAPNTNSEGRVIYVGGLPFDVTKQGVAGVMKKFGPVRSSDSIQLRRHEDGFCCGFVEFEYADAARRAVQAHYVQFGDKEAYITYKKSNNRGNDGRGRSPTRGAFRNDNFNKGYENGEVVGNKQRSQSGNRTTGFNNGQVRERPRQNRPSDQWRSVERNGRRMA